MKKTVVYLDRPTDVKVMRFLQRSQRVRKTAVVIRHHVFAKKLNLSESTIKRAIRRLVEMGHITKAHLLRPTKGGFLCAYRVRTDVIYRVASMIRRVNDLLPTQCKQAPEGRFQDSKPVGSSNYNYSNKYRRSAYSNVSINDLISVAKIAGIPKDQLPWLTLAAKKYGVYDAWEALRVAFNSGRARNPVKYAWDILKRWFPKGAIT